MKSPFNDMEYMTICGLPQQEITNIGNYIEH